MEPSRIRSAFRFLRNNVFLVALSLFICFLGTVDVRLFVLLLLWDAWLLFRSPRLFLLSFVVEALFLLHVLYLASYLAPVERTEASGKVMSVSAGENGNTLLIAISPFRYVLVRTSAEGVVAGMRVQAEGEAVTWAGRTVPWGFSLAHYYRAQRIVSEIRAATITVKEPGFSLGRFRSLVLSSLAKDHDPTSASLLSALLFGDRSLMDEGALASFKTNGVMHLFAVSGLHVDFMVAGIISIGGKIHLPEKITRVSVALFLLVYVILTAASPSILRASLMYFGNRLAQKARLGTSSLDVVAGVFILMLLANPMNGFLPGFALSFISVFTLSLSSTLFTRLSPFLRLLATSTLLTAMSLPYVIGFTHEVNLLAPFMNILYITLVTALVFPLSVASFFLPYIDVFYAPFATGFLALSRATAALSCPVSLPDFSTSSCLAYYGIFILLSLGLSRRKRTSTIMTVTLTSLFLVALLVVMPTRKDEAVFLDCPQGDATFISYQGTNVLIDTGSEEDGVVLDYLRARGVRRLDALVITHPDHDHDGGARAIIATLSVKDLVLNPMDETGYADLPLERIVRVHDGDTYETGSVRLKVLSPSSSGTTNEESLVFTVRLNGLVFLFTGDATSEVLEALAPRAGHVDILKVSHHGSLTGTSRAMLASLSPACAVIMTGHVASFGFPHPDVIAMLKGAGVVTYRTDQDGSVIASLSTGRLTGFKALEKEKGLW